jgi:flagellar hook assembly protein FlgD
MDVFDITGRLIRTYNVTSPAGTVTWDGTTAAGEPVASGTYFIRLEAGGEAATRRVVLLR